MPLKKILSSLQSQSAYVILLPVLLLVSICKGQTVNVAITTVPFTWVGAAHYYAGTIQTWQVPPCVTTLTITAVGGSGANTYYNQGGVAAKIGGVLTVTPGDVLDIIVAGQGESPLSFGQVSNCGGGGGGGSFVWDGTTGTLYVVAGGGGGAGAVNPGPVTLNGANGQTANTSAAALEAATNSSGSAAGGTGGGANSGGLAGATTASTCSVTVASSSDGGPGCGGAGWGENGIEVGSPNGCQCGFSEFQYPGYGIYPLSAVNPGYGGAYWNADGHSGTTDDTGARGGFGGGAGGGYNGGGGGGGYNGGGGGKGANTSCSIMEGWGGGGGGSYFNGTTATIIGNGTASSNGSVTIQYNTPVGAAPTINSVSGSAVTCYSSTNGTASVSASGGSSTPYTYSWSPTGGSGSSASGLSEGTYTVSVADLCGPSTTTVTITGPAALVAQAPIGHNVTCAGAPGSATESPSGGTTPYTYSWSPAGGTTSSGTGLTAGTYTVTVRDNCGDPSATASVTISAPTSVTTGAPTSTSPSCGTGGTATETPVAGTTPYGYSWSPTGGTNSTATGLNAGTYTVTVSNQCGSATASVTITQAANSLTANAPTVTNILCNGTNSGSAAETPSGGATPYTYSWSPAGGATSTASGLSAGTYTITVTDHNSCTAIASATITAPAALTPSASVSNVSCGQTGATATVTGGTSPYTYSWNPGGQRTSNATGISTGTYTVTVTDNNNCSATASTTITSPPAINVSTAVVNVTCGAPGHATATAAGGTTPYTYSWNPGGQTTSTATGMNAGTYTITATDNSGCTATASATITAPAALISASVNVVNAACGVAGSASATATGGTTPYTYSWNPGGQTTSSISGLNAGTYTVTVTDNTGCTQTAAGIITQGSSITTTTSSTPVFCNGGTTGSATVNASGGTTPYHYVWSPGGQNGSTANDLSAGTYTVTVTDETGCAVPAVATVAQASQSSIAFSSDITQGCSPLCVQFNNLTPVNTAVNTSYVWTFGNGDSSSARNPVYCYQTGGVYSVGLTVTIPADGCSLTLNKINMITVFPSPTATFSYSPQPITIISPTVQFTDNSTGPHQLVQWWWTFGDLSDSTSTQQNPSHTYQDTGTYCTRLVVTDVNGCADTAINCLVIDPLFTLYIPDAFSPNGDGTNDVFMAKGDYVKNFEMYIFDRWGQQLFHSTTINKGWDGTYKGGTVCQQDIYVYKILATDYKNKQHSYIGSISLVK